VVWAASMAPRIPGTLGALRCRSYNLICHVESQGAESGFDQSETAERSTALRTEYVAMDSHPVCYSAFK
jgi:hypothetical protein